MLGKIICEFTCKTFAFSGVAFFVHSQKYCAPQRNFMKAKKYSFSSHLIFPSAAKRLRANAKV